jgi:hypothetical protein
MGWLARAVAVVAVVAACLAACSTGRGSITVVLAGVDGGRELPVTLVDRVGIVLDANEELGGMGVMEDIPVANPPGRPDKVRVAWTGGACDRSADMEFRADGAGFVLAIVTTVDPGGCDAIGIGRELMITFSRPVNAASVVLAPSTKQG